ncbi:MAG: ImmA/IrrE family metallo-endopeptidase [Actinomycetota bacterium]
MATEQLTYQPDYAIQPGATLRSTLAERGMTQADLAARTGLSLKHINQIVQGNAPITHETALLLEKTTGVPARLWNALEANYRDRLARREDKESLAGDAEWLDELPVKELVKRGHLNKDADVGTRLQEVCRFFGVADRAAWESVWREPLASFRKSPAFKSDAGAVATWLRLGELEAERIECKPFDARRFRAALHEIRALTVTDPEQFVPRLVSLCAESGVAVVFVPEIPGTRASGAARWLTPTKALIQLSLRGKSDDRLWFSFFHEAAHLLLHGKKEVFIHAKREGPRVVETPADIAEKEADSFAATLLIPRQFDTELRQLRTVAEIQQFAQRLGIAPGIVVGRLQNDGILKWNQCNKLKRRLTWADEKAG